MPDEIEPVDTALVSESLQKVAKGTGLVFVGSIISILFAFLSRILVARHYTQAEYGIFSLGFTIFSILTIIGSLGLQDGLARQIAYYIGKKEEEKINAIIFISILLSILSGVISCILLFFLSDFISNNVFKTRLLSHPLKIFSIAIPFYILLNVLTAIYRGFGRVKEKVIFMDVGRNILFFILLLLFLGLHLEFIWATVAFFLSVFLITILLLVYFLTVRKPSPLNFLSIEILQSKIWKELLSFSLPLLFVSILYLIMNWTDTLMIGYFKTAENVGLYNAALPLGQFVSSALAAMLFVYMPIVSMLYAKNKLQEVKRTYVILTKWLTVATFPLALIFACFPSTTIQLFFGEKYANASQALQILAIGFFINNLMGPNGATLTAMGKTKFLMYATFIAAIMNMGLNIILIPIYGINGAAIATVISLILINIIRSIKLYSISGIHSLEKNIVKPILLSVVLVFIIYFIAKNILVVTFWMLPLLFITFLILYIISLIFTKSFDREDLEMLSVIEKKTGTNLSIIKKIIKRN